MVTLSVGREPTTVADWCLILDALQRLESEARTNPTKSIHKHIDADKAYQALADGLLDVRFVDGYMVVFGTVTPWYSNATILSELLIVRVGEGGTLRGVVQFLKDIAEYCDADLISVGTAFAKSDRALSRLYQAEGLTPSAITLTMEA